VRRRIANANDISKYNLSHYSISILPPTAESATSEGLNLPDSPRSTLRFYLGSPIMITWEAPENHSPSDWIGIYRQGANQSKLVTRVASQGKWWGVCRDEWDGDKFVEREGSKEHTLATHGTITFSDKKLPWTTGTYEFRYHHDGKHNVMTISRPFEVYGKSLAGCSENNYVFRF
jgi:phosphatidylethanolamine N-methyltransferase